MKWTLGLYRGYIGDIGIMEKKMETTILYWDYIGAYFFGKGL